jgi:hypothetical protein
MRQRRIKKIASLGMNNPFRVSGAAGCVEHKQQIFAVQNGRFTFAALFNHRLTKIFRWLMLHLIEKLIILNQPHRDRRRAVMKRQDFLFFWLRE